jgi:hypothetical protein
VAEKGAARVPTSRPGCEHCKLVSGKISLANFQVPMLYVVSYRFLQANYVLDKVAVQIMCLLLLNDWTNILVIGRTAAYCKI